MTASGRRGLSAFVFPARLVIGAIAAFYAYGALVHIGNIAHLSGFDWGAAPLKWQLLDLLYLALDLVVVAGLLFWWPIGFVALFVAAVSQIVLYTLLRAWLLDDVTAGFAPPGQAEHLDWLVVFHIVTVGLGVAVLTIGRRTITA